MGKSKTILLITFLSLSGMHFLAHTQSEEHTIYQHNIDQLKTIKNTYEKMLTEAQDQNKERLLEALSNIDRTISMFREKMK